MREFIITAENEGQRFDKYIHRILGESSMSFIYKMLRKKNFVLNDKKANGNEILNSGDVVKLYLSDDTFDKFSTKTDIKVSAQQKFESSKQPIFNLNDNIIYEDANIVLINKPYGILSQKAKKGDISVNELLIDYLFLTKQIDNDKLIQYKPAVVNRLDRNTSGIIIAAKTLKAAQVLSNDLKDRTINKYYICVVVGAFNATGIHKGYITKDNNSNTVKVTKQALNSSSDYIETGYELIRTSGDISFVKVHLITGKSHQIRAHLSYLGFPILGDPKYGIKSINKKYKENMQLLHAYKVVFPNYDNYGFSFSNKTFESEPEFLKRYK